MLNILGVQLKWIIENKYKKKVNSNEDIKLTMLDIAIKHLRTCLNFRLNFLLKFEIQFFSPKKY